MRHEEITEEMWDKIEAEGIVVLQNSKTEVINFVRDYCADYTRVFVHSGDEIDTDLETVVSPDEGWRDDWEIVKRPEKQTTIIDYESSKDPVVEWLDKASYVYTNDNSIESFILWSGVEIETSHGDVRGTQQVVEFINNRYELLQKEVKSNKQKELAEKKARLLEELKVIDKELDGL